MIRRFVILGASGDLTARYLLPALASLHEAGKLPTGFAIVGVDRAPWDTDAFRRQARERLEHHAAELAQTTRQAIVALLTYRRADVTDRQGLIEALSPIDEPLAIYLALPPLVFGRTIETLAGLTLPPGSRIVVEKPFGVDLASAQALNRLLHETFPERGIFRLDHFLGMQTVQNILALRFANRVFEPLWNCQHIERVEIIWDETLTVEGRAAYYDATGALRDMIQNHLLQLLCLIAMEAPTSCDERDLRDRKVDVLRAIHRFTPAEVERWTVRGRYRAGRIGQRVVPAYVDEEGVDPNRDTETFAQVSLTIKNWRWSGVPFVLRSGKALARDRREIGIYFRPVPHLSFGPRLDPRRNLLRLDLEPDCIALGVNIKGPGGPPNLQHIELARALVPPELPTYGRLVLDVLTGDPTLSIRDDEIEESWRIVDPILAAWAQGRVPLREYPAGSEAY